MEDRERWIQKKLQITGATDMTLMQDGRTALQAAGKRQSAQ